jgi:hypothetical protein
MILYDSLLPGQFCYIIVYIWKVESHLHITDWCVHWIISSGGENPCFLGAAILRGTCQLLIPRRGKHKSLLI